MNSNFTHEELSKILTPAFPEFPKYNSIPVSISSINVSLIQPFTQFQYLQDFNIVFSDGMKVYGVSASTKDVIQKLEDDGFLTKSSRFNVLSSDDGEVYVNRIISMKDKQMQDCYQVSLSCLHSITIDIEARKIIGSNLSNFPAKIKKSDIYVAQAKSYYKRLQQGGGRINRVVNPSSEPEEISKANMEDMERLRKENAHLSGLLATAENINRMNSLNASSQKNEIDKLEKVISRLRVESATYEEFISQSIKDRSYRKKEFGLFLFIFSIITLLNIFFI